MGFGLHVRYLALIYRRGADEDRGQGLLMLVGRYQDPCSNSQGAGSGAGAFVRMSVCWLACETRVVCISGKPAGVRKPRPLATLAISRSLDAGAPIACGDTWEKLRRAQLL